MLCAATLKLYCPIAWDAGEICFDDLFKNAISARPLVRPQRDFSKFISRRILRMFTSPLLARFSPELVENICLYLDPYPELVAIVYAISVAKQYRTCLEPSWTDAKLIKAGMTLHMTFNTFDGRAYLTTIDLNPSARCSKMLQVQDELLICRDHFAIRDIYNISDQRHRGGMGDRSLFYHALNVREIGRKGLNIQAFSDVSTNQLEVDPLNLCRGCS